MRRRAPAIAVACLLLLGGFSSSADARGPLTGGLFGEEAGTHVEFTLGKAPHTVLELSTSGQRVTLEASRGSGSVSYEVPGTVSGHRVKANFGRAGKVDLRFKPSGPPQSVEPFPFCKGKDGSVSTGTFVGTIRFTGFDRFVHFHASRAKGKVSKMPPVHCHFPGGPRKHPPAGEGGEEEDRNVALSASRPCAGPRFIALTDAKSQLSIMGFAATSEERVGRVDVSRFVLLFPRRSPGFFSFDPGLASATVAPPPPFHGTATFQRGAEGAPSTWRGTLSVSFLDGRQALTGHRIEAVLEEVAVGGSIAEPKCELGHAQASALSIP